MSTTTQGIDAKGYLAGWLHGVIDMTISDINAIPDEQWLQTHGGCTRPCNSLIADAISMLDWIAAALEGKEIQPYGEMAALTEKCATKAGAVASLTQSKTVFTEAFNAASDETLNTAIKAPWGPMIPLFLLAQIAINHVWYHDGQLNYIQALLGDGEMHWTAPKLR